MMSVGDGEDAKLAEVNATLAATSVSKPGAVPQGVRSIDGWEIQDTLGKGMSGK